MAKTQNWEVEIDGAQYEISVKNNILTGKAILSVNGEEEVIRNKGQLAFLGIIDAPITVAGKQLQFVSIGKNADIAMDGIYLGSKEEYKSAWKLPWWVWIFVVLTLAIPVISRGGALPFLLGFLSATFCARASIQPKLKTSAKVLICFGITILAWLLLILIVFLLALLVNL